MTLQKAPMDVVRAAYDTTFNSVVAIILRSDDTSELQVSIKQIEKYERF